MTNSDVPILHIGYPKTGTTWFQEQFFPQIKNTVFLKHRDLPDFFLEGNTNDDIKRSSDFFKKYKRRIIVSDESLVGSITKNTFYTNPDKFRKIFGTVHIIIFIRNQIDKYASNYSQYITGAAGTCKIDEFLYYNNSEFPWGFEKHSYDKILNVYKENFPVENIHVYLFEEFQSDPKGFLRKLKNECHFSIDLDEVNLKRENKSLSPALIHLKRRLNYLTKDCHKKTHPSLVDKKYLMHIPYWYLFSRNIFKLINDKIPVSNKNIRQSVLGKKNIQMLEEFFRQSNRNLIDRHGMKIIKKYDYPI